MTEPNADVTGQSLGNRFFVEGGKEYSDLDELIVNHVQAIARRVEELMAHEKFKAGPEDELRESHLTLQRDFSKPLQRLVLEELRESQSIQERLRFYSQPPKAGAFQPLFLGKQKHRSPNLGKLRTIHTS